MNVGKIGTKIMKKDDQLNPEIESVASETNPLSHEPPKKTIRRIVTNTDITQFEKKLNTLTNKTSVPNALKSIKPALENAKEKGFSIQKLSVMATESLHVKITPVDIKKALGLIQHKKTVDKNDISKTHKDLLFKEAITSIGGKFTVNTIKIEDTKIQVIFISEIDWQNLSRIITEEKINIQNQIIVVQTQPKSDWAFLTYNKDKLTSKILPNSAFQKKQYIAKEVIQKYN
jgi:hypothetical protein